MQGRADIFASSENSKGKIVRTTPHGGLQEGFKLLPEQEEAFGKCDDAILMWCSDLFLVRKRSGEILDVNYRMVGTSAEGAQYGSAYTKSRTKAPAIAIERTSEEFDNTRYLNSTTVFKKIYPNPDQSEEVILSGKEIPYNVQYTLSIWTKSQEDMNYLKAQILKRLNPMDQVLIEGNKCDIKYTSSTDNSDFEPGEGDDKIVRYDIIIELESGLNPDRILVPTIHAIVLNYNTLESFEEICEPVCDEEEAV